MVKINLATKFTIFRIVLIPIILFILFIPLNKENINNQMWGIFYWPNIIALIFFIIASITDAIDGHIARKYHMITNLGKFLDPVADKLLVNSLLIYLAYTDNIPVVLVIIMIARDILVDALRFIAAENKNVIAASIYGKLKTILQMALIIAVLLFSVPFQATSNWLVIFAYITTIVSVWAGIDYFIKNRKVLSVE